MSDSEENKPEMFWQKAFDEASEMPPPRVWDAIERQLDKSEKEVLPGPKIIPLWGTGLISPKQIVWSAGIAATVAVLLIGWWMQTTPIERTQAERDQTSAPEQRLASPRHESPSVAANAPQTDIDQHQEQSKVDKRTLLADRQSMDSRSEVGQQSGRSVYSASSATNELAGHTKRRSSSLKHVSVSNIPRADYAATQSLATGQVNQLAHPINSRPTTAAFVFGSSPLQNQMLQAEQASGIIASTMAGRQIRYRDLSSIQRIVWISPAATEMEEKVARSDHKYHEAWASVSVMPGSFDPAASVRPGQATFTNAYALSTTNQNPSQPSVTSRPNLSLTFQASAGIQVSKHWSIESGVGYLSGHSQVESPAQVTTSHANTAINRQEATGNLYLNALQGSRASTSQKALADLVATNSYQSQVSYDAVAQQTLTNNYQYVQVPVQIGYQLRPRKRFSLALLGGLLTNIFVRNTVGDNVVINSKDGVYRPLSWSATLGARFRYRPSRRWSASMAGVYQSAFGSDTESTAHVQNHITATGMSFGVDYHF